MIAARRLRRPGQGQACSRGEKSGVAQQKKTHAHDELSSFMRFVRSTVAPLSRAFSASPLMQLRVRNAQGSVTLTKVQPAMPQHHHADPGDAARPGHSRGAPAVRVYQGDAGRPYDTINAEVVGVFRDLAEPPATGERLVAGRVLGHIEALRLRNEVRCPNDCTLIAQVVVDGQPVDFGEPLFVVDSGVAPPPPAGDSAPADGAVEAAEPPRM